MKHIFDTENQELAYSLAKRAHGNQLYGVHSYVDYHVMGVVNIVKDLGFKDDFITVALLHDVIEDTSINANELFKLFDSHIIEAVELLTKYKELPNYNYDQYLKNIKQNQLAKIVKIADATFNMNENIRNKGKRVNFYANVLCTLTA